MNNQVINTLVDASIKILETVQNISQDHQVLTQKVEHLTSIKKEQNDLLSTLLEVTNTTNKTVETFQQSLIDLSSDIKEIKDISSKQLSPEKVTTITQNILTGLGQLNDNIVTVSNDLVKTNTIVNKSLSELEKTSTTIENQYDNLNHTIETNNARMEAMTTLISNSRTPIMSEDSGDLSDSVSKLEKLIKPKG